MSLTRRRVLVAALASPLARFATGAERERLFVYNWNNYVTPETIADFEHATGCRLVQDYYADNEEMLAKLAAGATGYDLIVPTGNAVETLVRERALRPLDKRLLPRLANIKPEFMNGWFDQGNVYSVPYAYSITLLGWNAERLREAGVPTDTWAAIFEPRHLAKLRGKVTVLDSQRELVAAALIHLGHPANDADPAHWREARDLILRAKPYWAAFNAASYFKELTIGNIWLAHGYSNDMYTAAEDARRARRPFRIEYATPREGGIFALDNLVLHVSGRQNALAHRFIDFVLDGARSARLTNAIGAGNPNADAMRYIRPELAANRTLFPDAAGFAKLEQLRDLDRRARRLLNRIWIEIKVR